MSPTTNNSTCVVTSIKVSYLNELRRFPFPIDSADDQFSVIYRTIAKSFGLQRSTFVLQYVDDENDIVTVGSQLELTAALNLARLPVLRLSVVVRESPVVTPPTVVATATEVTPSLTSTPSTDNCRAGFRGGRGGHRRMIGGQLQEQYREQLAELEREGLNCGFWAIRVLANLNGDVEAAKTFIRSRKNAMMELKTKYASQLAELERLGILEAGVSTAPSLSPPHQHHQQHQSPHCMVPVSPLFGGIGMHSAQFKNHHCLRKCIRLLEEFNGDVQQVVMHFERKRAEREALPTRFASQLAELKAQGFWCEPVCLRLLNKFNGDTVKVAECMNKFRKHHLQQGEPCSTTTTTTTATAAAEQQQQQSAEFDAKIEDLVAKGYPRPKAIRLLRKFDGNAAQVERVLQARKEWFSDQKRVGMGACKRHAFKEAKAKYANEIAQLKEMGFKCKWLIIPLLIQNNGDVAAVSLALSTEH